MIALQEENRKVPHRRHWEAFQQASQLSMDPEEFIAYWDVDYADLARLVGCSVTTVKGWFCETGRSHREPKPWHRSQLARWHQVWQSIK
jgi:hypothetical protein